jgi:MYXO-CTERM domain-containing protein
LGKNSKLKKLARTLLTTTCLTAAAACAGASTFLESSLVSGDFSNNLNSPTALPAGVTDVYGKVSPADLNDYFSIPGLTAGGSYFVTFEENFVNASLTLYDGTNQVAIAGPFNVGGTTAHIVPPSTIVEFGVNHAGAEFPVNYIVSFSTTSPEPGTLGLAGAALAGALTLRRRRKN